MTLSSSLSCLTKALRFFLLHCFSCSLILCKFVLCAPRVPLLRLPVLDCKKIDFLLHFFSSLQEFATQLARVFFGCEIIYTLFCLISIYQVVFFSLSFWYIFNLTYSLLCIRTFKNIRLVNQKHTRCILCLF